MVDDAFSGAGTARTDFDRLRPFVFFEISRDGEVLILDFTFGGDFEGFWNFEDGIGGAAGEIPADGPVARRRSIVRIAFGSAGIGPIGDGFDFGFGQPAIVQEPIAFGEPRRHNPAGDGVADGFRPGADVFVSGEGHGRDFAGAVAFLASILEDREDVAIKSWSRSGTVCVITGQKAYDERGRYGDTCHVFNIIDARHP